MSIISFLRSFRIEGFAIFDFVASFVGMWFLGPLLSRFFRQLSLEIPRISRLYRTLPLGFLVHLLVGSATPLNLKIINLQQPLFAIAMILLTMIGLKGVKFIATKK